MPQEKRSTRAEIKYVYKLLNQLKDCSVSSTPRGLLYEPDRGGYQKLRKESLKAYKIVTLLGWLEFIFTLEGTSSSLKLISVL